MRDGGPYFNLGWNQQQIADYLDRGQKTISEWLSENYHYHFPVFTEELLQEAIDACPDENGEVTEIVEDIREERIFGEWSEEERELLELLRNGETIVSPLSGSWI